MRIDIATLFPEMCEEYFNTSIIGRAKKAGKIDVHCHNIRRFAGNARNSVDDYPYSGGPGMVMQAEPIAQCCEAIAKELEVAAKEKGGGKADEENAAQYIIFMGAAGTPLTQEKCKQLAQKKQLTIVCGHYEGIDQRVVDTFAHEEISIGDYVLTGGELAALVLADSVLRLCPGVLSAQEGYEDESHYSGLLEYPQYTRPEVWRGQGVPAVLLSGNHAQVAAWRTKAALERTEKKRPDMYETYVKNKKPCKNK